MTTALEGVSGQQHAPVVLYPWERPGTHCTGGWVGLRASPEGRKISPHWDFFCVKLVLYCSFEVYIVVPLYTFLCYA